MATRSFDLTVQLDGRYTGDRWWTGNQIHSLWNVENMNTSERSQWGADANGWLQYRSLFSSYSIRYNPYDVGLRDYYFETDIQPAGSGNYEVGVVFRFKDRFSFYYLTFNGGYQDWGGKNIRLMKVTGANHIKIAEYTCPVFNTSKTYKFRVDLVGGNISIKMDGLEIINLTDPTPIASGAFGPIVKGQEFAKWRGFQAMSVSAFLVQKVIKDNTLTSDYYDAGTSKLIYPQNVGTLLQPEIEAALVGKDYNDLVYDMFRLSSSNDSVKVIFDKTLSKNTSSDRNSLIYAYQILPASPPIPITDLQGVPLSPTEIRLRWTHPDNSEDGYKILDDENNIIGTVGENVTEFIETGLTEGITYTRKVVAFNAAGDSLVSNSVIVTTLQTIPTAPSDFSGTALNDKQIRWRWTDNSFNEHAFEIIKRDDTGKIIIVKTLDPGITEYVENNLTYLTEYTRSVRAKNTAGISGESNEATVRTMDFVPDPPQYAPINFFGVGVADDSIVWTWEDKNIHVLGFEILDEQNNVIARTNVLNTTFTETGLYSKMSYRRKVRAYNEGGAGPSTTFASAFTLGYGYDYTGHPVNPFNLSVVEVSDVTATIEWDYEDHVEMPAIGFKIYNDMDLIVDTLPLDVKSRTIQGLLPDTTYRFYVVAFNELGDSLPSNLLTLTTLDMPISQEPEESEKEDGIESLNDPLLGVSYDEETRDTPKIEAFQSGVGDNLDLVVRNLFKEIPNFEEFIYEMCIKGYYQADESYYPEVPFEFQVTCNGVDVRRSEPYTQTSQWFKAMVQGAEGKLGITYASSLSMKIPIYVTGKKFSVVLRDMKGTEIPMFRPNQPEEKVNWVLDPYEVKEVLGYVDNIYMKNVFLDWRKFSHQGTKQPSNVAEMDAWRYNAATDELICTQNTGTFVGAVSPDYYDNFETRSLFRSNNRDNDAMAFIIAFAVDALGREHTLSAVRNHTLQKKWALYYNFRQSNEILLAFDDNVVGTADWNLFYPKGTVIEVSRKGDDIVARTSDAGEDEVKYEISVDLNSRPQLNVFKGPQSIGVASWSQESASLKIEEFYGEKTEVYTTYNLRAWTSHKENRAAYKEWVSAKSVSQVMKVHAFEELKFNGRIQSPAYQIPWQEINEEFTFNPDMYKLVITCSNPNVEFTIEERSINFFPENSTFVNIPLSAKIVNHTQTAWNPHVHHGYYYLNQREHYLYSDDKVLPQDDGSFATYVYNFPYVIRAYGERNYDGQDTVFTDEYTNHFLVGTLGEGVDVDVDADSDVLTITDSVEEGVFTSRLFDFGKPVDSWREFIVSQDDASDREGSDIKIEIGKADEFGQVSVWREQPNNEKVVLTDVTERVRYRLTLKAGQKAESFLMDFNQNNSTLGEGYGQYIKITDRKIEIDDPEFRTSGTFMTKVLEYGSLVSDMGTVTVDIDMPTDSNIELYSVSAESREHDFKNPTSASPWIPLELVSKVGKQHTYRIRSAKNPWLVIVAKLHRGFSQASSVPPVSWNATTMDMTLATNLVRVGTTIQLNNLGNPGIFQSRAINITGTEFFKPVNVQHLKRHPNDKVRVYTITGATTSEVEQLAADEQNWKETQNDVIQSLPNKWFMYRVVLTSGDGLDSPELTSVEITFLKSVYSSPVLDNMVVQGRLFNWIRVVPRVSKVTFSGYVEKGFGAEDYLIPMMGEVVSDGLMQPITTESVESIAWNWLANQGVANISELILKDFFVEADPAYPVELQTDRSGKEPVKAKTNVSTGDLIWRQEKLFFDEEKQEIVVQPVPQTGSPIVIKNAQGTFLRQVHFRDVVGKPTLTNLELLETDETRYLFLEYMDVDPGSVKVFIDFNQKNEWSEIFDFEVIQNRIVLNVLYLPRLPVRVLYKLKDSFYVDYNHDPSKGYALIKVNTSFDAEIKETKELDIKYEVNKEHAYYLSNEVDLNPLHNRLNSGFIYLTDEIYPPYKIELFANPNKLVSNKEERVNFNAYVLDEYGNPVVGESVSLSCDYGTLSVVDATTDMNGMITAIYMAANDPRIKSDTITATVVSRHRDNHLSKNLIIEYVQEKFSGKLAIVPEKRIVNKGDVVQLKVIAMGPSNERLVNKEIELTANVGRIVPSTGTTNPNGELFVSLYYPTDSEESFILLQADATDDDGTAIREQNILGVSGV